MQGAQGHPIVFDPNYTIYGVKGVTAIPLVEERAKRVLKSLATRNAAATRSSRPAPIAHVIPEFLERSHVSAGSIHEGKPTLPHVKIADDQRVKVPPPLPNVELEILDRPPTPSSSVSSTNSSDHSLSSAPISKTVSDRLSFWNRLSTMSHEHLKATGTLGPVAAIEESESFNSMIHEGKEDPATILTGILAKTAPPPSSIEDKHTELEEKILRECIKSFSKGDMYFAYNFGAQFPFTASYFLVSRFDTGWCIQRHHSFSAA